MNVMRKLRGAASAPPSSGSSSSSQASPGSSGATAANGRTTLHTSQSEDAAALLDARIQMSLATLKKLFNEYTHPKEPLSEQERDGKLYQMLPLFCKVFSSCPANDMSEKFWDVVAFCQQVSRLMVSEIRKRASNQSTEAASIAIVKFLEIETTEETSSGWMLLSTLNLLANGDVSLIQVMTAASVPSTLVKCLYLFFDLPHVDDDPPPLSGESASDFNAHERRTLLQKVFVQLLVKLCSYPYPAEELARMDDLTLLFSAITSPCPTHNIVWRKNAAEILTTISRHGLTDAVVSYIHSKGCMALCVDNMQRLTFGNPLEIVEMFVTVFCFLKDSSQVSQILMDDFRASQGYVFLSDFLLKFDTTRSHSLEIQAAIRNLVLMISSLCMCGFYELRPPPAQFNTVFKMQNFQLPQASSRETCVRNIYAFQVLQTVFLKSTTPALCCTILDAISRVYHSENANYFILESENTLSSFAERIHHKGPQIQEKFFDLLEFIVFQLNFVPCKELISLSLLLKNNHSTSCSILCLKTLLNILRHNNVFKDVYRELGIMEILVGCLNRYGDHVRSITAGEESLVVVPEQEDLIDTHGKHVLEALTILLGGASNNANVFRECGGAKCVHELVKFKHCRPQALGIIRELILSAGGDDDMLYILSLMHGVSPYQVEFKIQILNMLLGCLKDSHRTRTVFRKVGGFVYLTSVFVSLDGSLADATVGEDVQKTEPPIPQDDLILLLQIVCQTLTTAMRFEPANAKFFHQEICTTSLCDTLRLLGCFGSATTLQDYTGAHENQQTILKYYHEVFSGDILNFSFSSEVPHSMSYVCVIYRLLYSIALDNFEAPNLSGIITLFSEPAPSRSPSKELAAPVHPNQLNLSQPTPEPRIVHPGVVLCMLQLLPSVQHEKSPLHALQLQVYLSEIIKSLVRSERNQQIMCDNGLAEQLLKLTRRALAEEMHPLHVPMQYILERLAAQALQPTELRDFLRLGEPLSCNDIDLQQPYRLGGPVPLTRIKTLVSMTTPRDFRAHGSSTLPPFVELNMSAEGFGCLYLPSLAPQATATAGGTIDSNTIGGIGAGDRIFPPPTGLSYSTWFCVEKFSDPKTDPHCVRLLTLVRTIHNPREENLACLSILLSARDKAIVVSTQETLVTPRKSIGDWEPEGSDDGIARIWCPDLLHEGQWHNLVVVLNRAVLKNSSLSLYLDGVPMHTQKLHYIAQNPGATSANLAAATQVFGYIGTPPIWRRYSRLCWKQGVCHLLEDVLTQQTVQTIYQLGPHYMGSLQAPQLGKQAEPLAPLVPEDRVLLGLNAKAVSKLTLVKIRKVYSRADNKSIAKQLNMNSHENATPIKILHNSAGHLAGAGRSLGGVVVGYLGVRVFSPHPVSAMIDTVGGCNVLLGIIAMAQDVESLYAGVKALTCVVRSNRAAQVEMDRKRCYQTLGMFFKKKKHLLNSHILHLTFGLVGTVSSGQDMSAIPNITAFQDLLCDLEIWHNAPNGLLRSLLEHLLELAVESNEKKQNVKIMRELQLLVKLLHIITDITDHSTREILFNLLETLLGGQPRHTDLLLYGQYVAAKLPKAEQVERALLFPSMKQTQREQTPDAATTEAEAMAQNIYLRNRCLSLLHGLLFTPRNTVNYIICDDISKTLGMDWLLLFMQPHVHFTTVIIAVRILVVICANESFLIRFRDATHNGGYLRFTEMVSQRKPLGLGAQQLNARPSNGTGTVIVATPQNTIQHLPTQIAGEVRTAALNIPGFQLLEWLLQHHLDVPELYFLVTALIMGQPVKVLATEHTKFDLDRVWSFLWGAPVSANTQIPKLNVCPEAVCVLLGMVRAIVHSGECAPWLHSHPETIIQLLFSLYQNLNDFTPVMMAGDVVTSLVAVLFPQVRERASVDSEPNSGSSTPTEGTSSSYVLPTPESLHALGTANQPKLTQHPVRKCIIDFLRVLVVDSLGLNIHGKSTPVIDLVLDASPETAELPLQVEYQSEIIIALMDHLLAADVLVGEQAALPLVPLLQSHTQHIAPNVFYLTARIVDKLWQGCLTRNPHDIFDFIIKLIAQAKRRSSSLTLEQLHHSLNRSILFLLSRPTESIAEQMSVLEALHKIIQHRLLIFGAGNHELEFIGCLTYCLLQLTADMKIILEPSTSRNTTWHVNPQTETTEPKDEDLNQLQGRNLIVGAAFRVWEELYVCKKPAIEEVFKISLTPPLANSKAPDLQTTREQVMELASKLWFNYVDAERKASYRVPWELHNQIQSKIQKVTGGLTRLASRTKVKKDELVRTKSTMSREAAYECTGIHVQLIKDLLELRCKQYVQMLQHTQRYVYQDWVQSETELTRERGLWGPEGSSTLDKWILDTTEGPHRMRKKTMRNDLFYLHYPYRPELELADNRQLKYKVASSLDSKTYFLHGQQLPRILAEAETHTVQQQLSIQQQSSLEAQPHKLQASQSAEASSTPPPPASPNLQAHGIVARTSPFPQESVDGTNPEEDDEEEDTSMTSDNETFLRLLEEQEKISFMFRCARVQGLDTFEGLLLFGKEHCYIVDGFTLLKSREIRDIDTLPPGAYDPIIPNSGGGPVTRTPSTIAHSHKLRQCSKFAYEEIREVHKRRYLLQPIALEVFSEDGRNYLLSFPRKVRNKVNQRFLALATALNDNAQQSVAGQKRTASVEQTSGLFSGLIGETSVTQRWVRGEISNFQYLMHLNTLAGRSYNDLMQYPVFPWILADYDSEELDFTNPKTFRDFSRPMGAQSEERLEQFQKRFKEWDDPHGETPPYHYGTHYSSAMIVCSYLVRLEPFSQPFLKLQGGHFDLADRMFHSIKEAWLSASKLNMADVKELIPEFFYLPEFLSNFNNFDLGTKQNGETLNHVILPPWAKQDPREFIRLHRSALECDYVSQNLHLWIDLIFGCKQQGPAAVDAVNVFHHLFYEGNVDIYNIDDPLKKNATIGFINNFGQIPKQLFKKAHPAKKMSNSRHSALIDPAALIQGNTTVLQTDRLFFHNLDNLKPSLQPIKELKGPVGQILQPDKTVFAVEQNKVMMPPSYTKYIAWGFADHSLRVGLYDTDRASFVSEAAAQNSGEILTCACPNAKMIVTAGTSSVVTIWKFDTNRKSVSVRHSLHGHTDAVTCLAASAAYNVIVSGSRDGTAIVWDMSRFTFVRQLRGHVGVVAAVAINDLTGEIATCSATWLHVWSINGDPLAMVNTCVGSADRMQQILCVAFSQIREWDQQNVVITGSTDGVVRMWSLEHTQVPIDRKLKRGVEVNSQDKPDEKSISAHNDNKDNKATKMDILKQMKSLSQPEQQLDIAKSGSESSISEASHHSTESQKSEEAAGTSNELTEPPPERRKSSVTGAKSLHEMKSATVDAPEPKTNEEEHSIRPSKSDTSLTDGFVVIDNDKPRGEQSLRKGFKWQRQLMFRSKLTMHTAYDRRDNAEPASITALTVSKDHKILYVGDARGRIFSWSVTEQPGRGVADHWLKDEGADQCVKCHVKFTLYERKHHCRNCGQVFCNKCSRFESEISRLRILKPVRVCQACYGQLRSVSLDN
ncbi:WD repeat and FYVE domain-containing protein 3 [Scaptodrosophila lebanonensis]|uniref:WD repeat and FYVE domain-containing protein 3 n=1 Tax=Drosophila lebanonensis TaxID=7225 RepID=A0A6J2TQP9_DROLE|nr:WD repeat and FYVE domain-containing protein 3 [Scaptodrosophila lebanonensis]XP_030377444.1 WD repeat and FYVE domain-containing protein 3 [Scaptodrosophila lebanonensis]